MLPLTKEQIKVHSESYSAMLEKIREMAEELLAVEILEYHNKNWLSGDPKVRSEQQQVLIRDIIALTEA